MAYFHAAIMFFSAFVAFLRHAMPCYVMLYHIGVSCYIGVCNPMFSHIIACHVMLYYAMSYRVRLCCVMYCYVMHNIKKADVHCCHRIDWLEFKLHA